MAYSVSKAATIHLMKSLAKALAPSVRVNCVSAGVMATDWSKGFSQQHIDNLTNGNALRRLTDVEDTAGVYGAFCAGGFASISCTLTTLRE